MKIYISGPISGHNLEERRREFAAVQETLEVLGHTVFNPMRNGLPADAPTRDHMRRDIESLLRCDAIFMMERWCHSAGCKVEIDVAVAVGLPVFFQEAQDMPKGSTVTFK
jgi:hypothetical protein